MNLRMCIIVFAVAVPQILWAGNRPDNLKPENLVAWCIVPFDAKKRTPAERAAMLKELGIGRSAYDWRAEHVAEFEDEILEYKKHGIEYFAFWGSHEKAFELFEKYQMHPQVWQTAPSPKDGTQEEKVVAAADAMVSLAERTKELGCKLGLYNHGGWGGEPENLVAVCKELHARGHDHVGIVYNWHHGHGHIDDWKESLKLMKPHLLCLNLNGMNPDAEPKILALGKGARERAMFGALIESGYEGAVGILDHQQELDSKQALEANLDGLSELVEVEFKVFQDAPIELFKSVAAGVGSRSWDGDAINHTGCVGTGSGSATGCALPAAYTGSGIENSWR